MKQLIIIILLITFFTSCNKLKKEFYDSGELFSEFYLENNKLESNYKEYYKNGNLKEIHIYKNGKRIDSSIYYYKEPHRKIKKVEYWIGNNKSKIILYDKNNKISEKGVVYKDSIKLGIWKYFTIEGKLSSVIEYKNINGKSYFNQEWRYNTLQELSLDSKFFEIDIRDTVQINENFDALINVPTSFYNSKTKITACIPAKNFENFNEDFSNIDSIDEACSFDFKTLGINSKPEILKELLPKSVNFNHVTIIKKAFKTPGKKLVRGIIYEYLIKEKDSLGLDKALENAHKMYFEIPVFVKDSV